MPAYAPGEPPIAAAVTVHGGRVLLVKRRVREGALSWQFPAGAVEPARRLPTPPYAKHTKKPGSP